jgi:hypothetical protein
MPNCFEMPGTVRQANPYGGPCNLLGSLVRETKTQYVYQRAHGLDAFINKRFVHLAPCPCCPDHPRSRFPPLVAQV